MSMFEALRRELRQAREADRPVVHIRLTADALQGSPTTTPLTPERARQFALLAIEHGQHGFGGVVADPRTERLLEVVVHPGDWADLLKEADAMHGLDASGPVRRVFGIPVVE